MVRGCCFMLGMRASGDSCSATLPAYATTHPRVGQDARQIAQHRHYTNAHTHLLPKPAVEQKLNTGWPDELLPRSPANISLELGACRALSLQERMNFPKLNLSLHQLPVTSASFFTSALVEALMPGAAASATSTTAPPRPVCPC